MELNHLCFISIIFLIISFFTSKSEARHYHIAARTPARSPVPAPTLTPAEHIPLGEWALLQKGVGVSAMHMQLLYDNKVVIFDRNYGPSNLSLPRGKCQDLDQIHRKDCTAHSILYGVETNTFRPLMVHTDAGSSSGAVDSEGTLIQTGGYREGATRIRVFTPCKHDSCDWLEVDHGLKHHRWFSSNHILPDGRVIIVGGLDAYTYEFFPKSSVRPNGDSHPLPFLKETTDPVEINNLYPFLHILPDGNLFIFANQKSILLNYKKHKVVRNYPRIPGERRSNPLSGSSVLLPLNLTGFGNRSSKTLAAEVMICGGAKRHAQMYAQKGVHWLASKTCGRLKVMESKPQWVMEEMPFNRVMPDMLLLPTADVIILNGASRGAAGNMLAVDPILNPVIYTTCDPNPSTRFVVLNPSTKPRMYQSAAILLPDGRILVGGSNPHDKYVFGGKEYPTDTSLEAFSPPYLDPMYADLRPSISSIDGPTKKTLSYGQKFNVTVNLKSYNPGQDLMVNMIAPSFTTHSYAMNQRLIVLDCVEADQVSDASYKISVYAPPSKYIAPPGYYMLFVVNERSIPSPGVWIKIE